MSNSIIESPILILAGGLGTRMSAETKGLIPKALVTLYDRQTFIDHLLDSFEQQNFGNFVFCLGEGSNQTIDHVNSRRRNNCSFHRFSTETRPLGTGGAIALAIKNLHIRQPFLVIPADLLIPYHKVTSLSQDSDISWMISSISIPETKEYLYQIREETSGALVGNARTNWFNNERQNSLTDQGFEINVYQDGGCGMINPDSFQNLSQVYLRLAGYPDKYCLYTDILPLSSELSRRGLLNGKRPLTYGLDIQDLVLDMGRPEGLKKARELMQKKIVA